jgi:hypothetical protein
MSYIVVHINDPKNIEMMDILPNEEGTGVQLFKTAMEASRFVSQLGLDFNSEEDPSDVCVYPLQ